MSTATKTKTPAPTSEQYGNLQRAYEYFNKALFGGELAPCLLTFGRDVKKCYGYFHAETWANREDDEQKVHTISLTPMHLSRPLRDVFGTLVHEMVHLWQEDHGEKKSRNGYHNKEWAERMKSVGLYPSSTGTEGGKEVGQKVSHYIIRGGPYDLAFGKIPEEIGLAWIGVQNLKKKKVNRNKVKYQCPDCDVKAWGKPDILLVCGDCGETLIEVD